MDEENNQQERQLKPITINDLSESLQAAVKRAGWANLVEVQQETIPYFQAKRDVMVQAHTGSGKTGAYLLPIMERINFQKKACQALILAPTRELAQQVAADAKVLAGDAGMKVVAVYGGSSYKPQIDAFRDGVHLVVATPGRVLDHLVKRNLNLNSLEILVFDEADRMLSMGFLPDMMRLKEFLPRRKFNTYMFSATFPAPVMRLTNLFLEDAHIISLSTESVYVTETRHVYYVTPRMDKDRSLVRIIEMENPSQAIIFCNTKDAVFYVTRVLQRFGYNADQISSDLSQNARDKVLRNVRKGKLRFLVGTDVAARGIDIPNLSHVFQYEPPEDLEVYIHRAGRTGRAGASGTAVMLVNALERRQVQRLAAHYKIEFEELPLPLDEDIENLVAQRLVGHLEAKLRDRDRLQTERMQRFVSLAKGLAEDEDGTALLAMLLDDTYHDWMHDSSMMASVEEAKAPKQGVRHSSRPKRRRK